MTMNDIITATIIYLIAPPAILAFIFWMGTFGDAKRNAGLVEVTREEYLRGMFGEEPSPKPKHDAVILPFDKSKRKEP